MDIKNFIENEIANAAEAESFHKKKIGQRITIAKDSLELKEIKGILEEAREYYAVSIHKKYLEDLREKLREFVVQKCIKKDSLTVILENTIQEEIKKIQDIVCDIIRDKLSLDKTAIIAPNADINEICGFDDLNKIEIIIAIEDKFDVDITDEENSGFIRVDDIVNHLWKICRLKG
jgi:acyl carrier protein